MMLRVVFYSVLGAALASCQDNRSEALGALREAESACGIPKGKLEYLGGSPDFRQPTADKQANLTVITTAVGRAGEPIYDCINGFRSSRGYRIQQLKAED